jgi:hypothetical protein
MQGGLKNLAKALVRIVVLSLEDRYAKEAIESCQGAS